jgi:hypothetical protein
MQALHETETPRSPEAITIVSTTSTFGRPPTFPEQEVCILDDPLAYSLHQLGKVSIFDHGGISY